MRAQYIPNETSRADAMFIEEERRRTYDWTLRHISPRRLRLRSKFHLTLAQCPAFAKRPLLTSVRVNGILVPLVWAEGWLEGNHRLAAALSLELATIPVYMGKRIRT
jgi:ParB-like chromosome segregation protein Spo0J